MARPSFYQLGLLWNPWLCDDNCDVFVIFIIIHCNDVASTTIMRSSFGNLCCTGTHYLKQIISPVSPLYMLLASSTYLCSLHPLLFIPFNCFVVLSYSIAEHFWQSSCSTSVHLNNWFALECVGQIH